MIKKCLYCGKEFKTSHSTRICCSRKCSSNLRFKPNNFIIYDKYAEMVVFTKGKELRVKISLCDYDRVSKIRWFARFDRYNFYFDGWNKETKKIEKLHRFILDCPADKEVDHINTNDHLDNRRENLKICSHIENMQNLKDRRTSSGYKFIKWHKQSGKWEFCYKNITLIRDKDIEKVINYRNIVLEREGKYEIA